MLLVEPLESRTLLSNLNFSLPLTAVAPLGSLVYQNTTHQTIKAPGNTDTYTLAIDPQQTLSAFVHPNSAKFQPTLTLFAPNGKNLGSITAAVAGENAGFPPLPTETGTYKIVVTGAHRSIGAYTISTILNALSQPGGTSDHTLATAQPLDSYATPIIGHIDRMAALGTLGRPPAPTTDFYSFRLDQGESVWVVVSSRNGKTVHFMLDDAQGDVLRLSVTGTNVNAALNNVVAGTYYVAVAGAAGAQYNVVITRGADFSIQPHSTPATAQNVTATLRSGDPGLGGALGYLTNSGSTIGTDFYAVNANVGDNLQFATSTPGGRINNFFPELLLFDPNGNLVAVAAGNAADGRNSVIDFTVPQGDAGTWTIEVTPSPNTEAPTQGEYGLLVTGATGA